jgi:hypothetical protein
MTTSQARGDIKEKGSKKGTQKAGKQAPKKN